MTDAPEVPAHPPMSKSQKKRMKAKAAKARKEAAAAAEAAAAESESESSEAEAEEAYDDYDYDQQQRQRGTTTKTKTSSSAAARSGAAVLNPHDALRTDLMSRGYAAADIDAATEQMWERDLAYDVADEVERYLLLSSCDDNADDRADTAGIGDNASNGNDVVMVKAPPSAGDITVETETLTPTPSAATVMVEEPVEETKEEEEEDDNNEDDDDDVDDDVDDTRTEEEEEEEAVPSAAAAAAAAAAGAAAGATATMNGEPSQQPSANKHAAAATATADTSTSGSRGRRQMNLVARLEVVSNSDRLGDGIYALTEWISKAAKLSEIADLCNVRKCRALSTILRRTIASPDSSNDEAVLKLASAILGGAGVGAEATQDAATRIANVTDALGTAITSARSVVVASAKNSGIKSSENGSDTSTVATNCPDSVADRIVSDLFRAVDKLRCLAAAAAASSATGGGGGGGEDAIRTLEAEIDALASSLPATSVGGLLCLLTKRDCHRTAAEKSSTIVSIAVAAAASPLEIEPDDEARAGEVNGDAGIAMTEEDATEMVATLLGDDYDAIMTAKAEYESLRSNLDAARSSTASERSDLVAERDGYKSERDAVNARLVELRKEMEQLEKDGLDLDAKVETIEEKLEELDSGLDGEVKGIKAGLSERSEAVKLEEAAKSVAGGVASLRAALDEAAKSSPPVGKSLDSTMTPEKVSNKMGIYFVRIRNYFKAEADCIEFIANRAASLEGGLGDLEREIDECKALGMATNVAHMTQSLKEAKRNISEDKNVVKMLQSEAEKMQMDFMGRLKEYRATSGGKQTNRALTSLQLSVLGGIRDAILRIGLEDKGLNEYIADVSADASSSVPVDTSLTESQIKLHFSADEDENEGEDNVDINDNNNGGKVGEDGAENGDFAASDQSPAVAEKETKAVDAVAPATANIGGPMPPTSPGIMPKLSWATATASTAAPKGTGKSLLEIQKEEMSAKQGA